MRSLKNITIALAGGLLFWAAWPVSPFTMLIFVAWLPLLFLEETVASNRKFFGLIYLSFLTWNIATTWWIWNASAPGAMGAFLVNSLLMCIPMLCFRLAKRKLGKKIGWLAFISFWMGFEYFHLHNWGLSWPWLTLGNVFAMQPDWIQWYQYTGTSGGTCWILCVNILLFLHWRQSRTNGARRSFRFLLPALIILALPIFLSHFFLRNENTGTGTSNIVVVQPNIDPYEKTTGAAGSFDAQLEKLIHWSETQIDQNTSLVVWPETALYLDNGLDETELTRKNFFLNPLWAFLDRHPGIQLFTGIESYRAFDHKTGVSARNVGNGYFVESYNGATILDTAGAHAFYHKSKLVPGVETLPWFLHFLDSWFEKFGGTTAGYTAQPERTIIPGPDGFLIAPSICYESIYGEFMRSYIKNGANLICIVTNDGWWKNTPGHRQHMNYARLRAIETRTWIARSANTGISCFIDPNGTVINAEPYDTAAAIKLVVPKSTTKTFFVRYGDLLSRLMSVVAVALLLWLFTLWILKKYFKHKFPGLQQND